MTFDSMSNVAAQQEYESAIQELVCNPAGSGYNKAINALMRLYPQWKQFEWEHCIQEDLREAKERE